MINNIKNKVAPYEHEGRWFKAFIEKDENGELKLTRCDLPGAELTENGLKLPEDFHAIDYKFDTHFTAPAVLAGQEQTAGGSEYELPIATANTLGGIKSSTSTGLTVDNEGVPDISLLEVPQIKYHYGMVMPTVTQGSLSNGKLVHCEASTLFDLSEYPHPFELSVNIPTPDGNLYVPIVCQAERDNSAGSGYYKINSTGIAKNDNYLAMVNVSGTSLTKGKYLIRPTVIGALFEIEAI